MNYRCYSGPFYDIRADLESFEPNFSFYFHTNLAKALHSCQNFALKKDVRIIMSQTLSICWWMKPSLFCVHILTPPFRYPLRHDLLPQELFNLQAPQHRPHPHNSRPIPFLRTSAHKANLIWEIPLGCPISRSGDIVLYLICLSPTAS